MVWNYAWLLHQPMCHFLNTTIINLLSQIFAMYLTVWLHDHFLVLLVFRPVKSAFFTLASHFLSCIRWVGEQNLWRRFTFAITDSITAECDAVNHIYDVDFDI